MTDHTSQRIVQNRGPIIEFDGREVDGYQTRQKGAAWTEVTLWETRGGAWIVEVANCSDQDGHVDMIDAHVLDNPDMGERQIEAMDAMRWSGYAREMAKRLGWSLIRRVD